VPFAILPGIYTGPVAKKLHGLDIAWLVSLVVAGLSYYLTSLSFSPETELAAIAASEFELDGLSRTSSDATAQEESQGLDRELAQSAAAR
jgi:hypothetical protein